jgi:hypothetical protein
MSTRSTLLALALGSVAVATAPLAHASDPGSPLPGTPNFTVHVLEPNLGLADTPASGETKTAPLPQAVVSGYLVMLKGLPCTGSVLTDPSTWSDIVVFWNGVNLPAATDGQPGGTPAANQATIISDPPDSVAHAGCSATHFPADPTVPITSGVDAGYAALPAGLAGLTENIVLAGTTAAATTSQTERFPGNVTYKPADAADAGAFNTYVIFSEIPALPPWGFALLGGTLLATAIVVLRRRGHDTLSTTV